MALSRLYVARDMEQPDVNTFLGGEAVVLSIPLRDRVTPNEDAALLVELSETAGVFAVADGAGGMPGGDRAAYAALQGLRARVLEGGTVLEGFDDANHAVIDLALGAATTLAVVHVDGGRVRAYHAGDSFALVVGQRGRRKLETIAHSPVGYAVEAGLLDEDEALDHEERHVVSNLLGTTEMRVEISGIRRLRPRDTLLVATDGLSDNVFLEEIVEIIRKGPLLEAARRLAGRAVAEMATRKPDDLSFVLYRPTGQSASA